MTTEARAIFIARVLGASLLARGRLLWRYPLNFWAWLAWPALFALGLVFTARAMAGPGGHVDGFIRTAGTADYRTFLGVGIATWMALNTILWSFGLALWRDQTAGTLEALWTTPTPRALLVAARGLAEILFAFLLFGLSLLEFRLLFGATLRGHPMALALVLGATLPALYGLGLGFASLVLWTKEAQAGVFIVRGVFTIFAGLTYPLAVLPDWMRAVGAWLPLTYTVEGVRAVMLQGAEPRDLGSVLLPLVGLGALLVGLGHTAFAWSERRVRRLGTVGTF